jgi:hypothetical protein
MLTLTVLIIDDLIAHMPESETLQPRIFLSQPVSMVLRYRKMNRKTSSPGGSNHPC